MSDKIQLTESEKGISHGRVLIEKRGDDIPHVLKVGSYLLYSGSTFEIWEVLRIDEDEKQGLLVTAKNMASGKVEAKTKSSIQSYYEVANDLNFDELLEFSELVYSGQMNIDEIGKSTDGDAETSSALAVTKSKQHYVDMFDTYRNHTSKVAAVKGLIENKVNALTSQISAMTRHFEGVMKKLKSIIFTLELYGGISEDIKQIREGEFAASETPIYLEQEMLFMDEEVGDPSNGGVSYDSVEKFYNWLNAFNAHLGYFNFELILPHEKCIAIMRMRRHASERAQNSYDTFGNSYRMEEEMKTCMLIRNGGNIWVIHSLMKFKTQLFPSQEELEDLAYKMKHGDPDAWRNRETSEEILEGYRNGMILIQGIFDRTNIIAPQGTINLLNLESINKGLVIYNYGKKLIEDGKNKEVFKWLFNEDRPLVEGMRILFNGFGGGYKVGDRVTKWYRHNNYPAYPDSGVYTVEKHENYMTFLYLPDEDIYMDKWPYEKKRTRRERVIVNQFDKILNVDEISHRDLEYLNGIFYDRKHRRDYLWLVTMMNRVKDFKLAEYEEEKPFMLMFKAMFKGIEDDVLMDYIFHWKTKNKWKRSLKADDQKAFRMITKKLKKDIKENNVMKLTANFSE